MRTAYAFATSIAVGVTTGAGSAGTPCWTGVVPDAALPAQPGPVFCTIDTQGPGTALPGANTWFDAFDHGLSFADWIGTEYLVFERVDGVFDSIHWRHGDHWMVDVAPREPGSPFSGALGGAMIRPNQTFAFEDGALVVETEFAAGHQDYANLAGWGEIVITTAAQPTGFRPGGTYAYDMFPGHFTLGLRLQADRHTIASLVDDSGFAAPTGRIWEMSFFQIVGTESFGGFPGNPGGAVWRTCAADDEPDTRCRDRFRLTLTETSLRVDVNGVRYFEQAGIPPLPAALTDGPIYVYLASMIGNDSEDVVRYHWDRFRVHPCEDDIDGNLDVGMSDLLQVLTAWGECIACPPDLNGSGTVDFADIMRVIGSWGPCG